MAEEDEGAFELEEELGLPQSGPVLDDGIYGHGGDAQHGDIYDHGDGQHEDTIMQEPQPTELQPPVASPNVELEASRGPSEASAQPQAPLAVGTSATAGNAVPGPSPPAQQGSGPSPGGAQGLTHRDQPEPPQETAVAAAVGSAPPAAVGGGDAGAADGEQGQQMTKQERDAINMQDAQESHQKVYLANLTWWTTDADVEALCAEVGKVTSMEFVVDRSNGKSRGCVLVEFATPEAAVQCKEQLHGRVLHGRPIVTTFQKSGPGVKLGPPYGVNTVEGYLANQGRGRGMYAGGRGRGDAGGYSEGDGSGRERFGGGWRGRGTGGRYGPGGRFGGMDGMMGRGAPGMPPMMMPPMMMPPGLMGMMPGMMPGLPGMMPGMPPM